MLLLTDLQVLLMHRIVLFPGQAAKSTLFSTSRQNSVVFPMIIDDVRISVNSKSHIISKTEKNCWRKNGKLNL